MGTIIYNWYGILNRSSNLLIIIYILWYSSLFLIFKSSFNISEDHTAKLLVGIIPCGAIVFISDTFPGNTTDKQITVKSNVLSTLNTGEQVMADKGFLIDDLLPDGK